MVCYNAMCKQSTHIDPPLAIGSNFIAGDNLTVIIDIAGAEHIYGTPHLNDILTEEGIIVGKEFILCLEDYIDKDYTTGFNYAEWYKKNYRKNTCE